MKRYVVLILIMFLILFPIKINAQRGCCSHHGGVAGCNSNGRQICNDGTLSPSCTCTPTVQYIYGCTDKEAKNYNANANKDNGSCKYYIYGCTDSTATNYNINAEKDDGSCEYKIDTIEEESEKNLIDLENIKDDIIYESINSSQSEEESNDDFSTGGLLLFGLGASALGTYIYKRKQKN